MAAIFSLITTASAEPLKLNARRQIETGKGKGDWQEERKVLDWEGTKTALIVCDMWDRHWCQGATERVGEMAPRMNEVVKAARAKGVFIIHAPSDTMKFYEGMVQRKRAQEAKKAVPPVELKRWCSLDPAKEAPLPIDDSDGGCDDEPRCKEGPPWPWTRQIATIEVADVDAVTDSAEAYNLLEERGITNVIVM
ncbi:MAG TPA: protein-signal peptide and transmembrane prediction, partial [Verrucomicrobiae bacterium]